MYLTLFEIQDSSNILSRVKELQLYPKSKFKITSPLLFSPYKCWYVYISSNIDTMVIFDVPLGIRDYYEKGRISRCRCASYILNGSVSYYLFFMVHTCNL